jgi:prepilin-type N-terminal cleavage/methylation domain-containing protein
MTTTHRRTISKATARPHRRAFTLTELLVVMGVIVLMIAMAVPLFNVFSASHSIEGAQNMVSAMLQRARARAIAMQERRGVFFFEDQATKKTGMLLVRIDDPVALPNPNANVLELDDNDEEIQLLPNGIGAAFMLGAAPTTSGGAKANTNNTTYRPYGLIAFDGLGRIVTLAGYTTVANDARYPGGATKLVQKYGQYLGAGATVGSSPSKPPEVSQAGLLLYDKTVLADLPAAADPQDFSSQQVTWLDQNGTAVVVNRYNGTLIKGQGE